jgi:hypothetical protein
MKKNKLSIIVTILLSTSLLLVGVQTSLAADTDYGDVTLTGDGFDSGNFAQVWDLTDGDIVISFTYDGNGLVDDAGAHAWAELGVRSLDTSSNFNPYSDLREVGYDYSCGPTTLYASKDIAVGTAVCTGDEDEITIELNLDDPWSMFQAHIHVATDVTDVPQTKKGNPIPGQFMISVPYDPPVAGDAFSINTDDIENYADGDTLIIAVHLIVGRPLDCCTETVWQIGDVELINLGTGWLENYADEFNWADPADPITKGPGLVADQPTYIDPFMVGTNDESEFPYNSNKDRNYATDFDVQWEGSLPFGGLLTVSWSPGQSAQEKKVVSGEGISSTEFTATGTPQPGMGWFFDTYPLVEHFVNVEQLGTGVHTINFQHTKGDGTFWDWIKLERPCTQMETAWADGEDFDGKNWATYISCTAEPIEVEGSGVWLATDFEYVTDTFDPDPAGSPTLDLDDKLMLQKVGGAGEGAYNLPNTPPNQWANHRFWWDRDGVDPWQNDETANTGGIYEIEINLTATSATTGEAYMKINDLWQGFETDSNWNTIELTPAGMNFTGDMKHLQIFYGLYGYGATHSVTFSDITVTQ